MNIKPNVVVVFPNKFKKAESHPDMKGEAMIVCPHCNQEAHMEVVLWGKTGSSGKSFLSGHIKKFVPNEWNTRRQQDNEIAKKEYEKPDSEKEDMLPF